MTADAALQDWAPWITIAGMALVTYVTRIGGFLAFARVPDSGLLRRILDQVPGATFAALVLPRLILEGPSSEWLAAAALFVALWRGAGPLVGILVYVAVVALLRAGIG